MKDEIRFSSENGFAPFYISPNGTVYTITDEKISGKYYYTLKSRTRASEISHFKDPESVERFIKEHTQGRKYEIQKYTDQTGYFMTEKILVVSGLTVKTLYTPDILAAYFESYHACLEYAKEYIGNQITDLEILGMRNSR